MTSTGPATVVTASYCASFKALRLIWLAERAGGWDFDFGSMGNKVGCMAATLTQEP
jgi:hypothetical protein